MVRYAEAIRRLLQTSCLIVFDHFVGLALKELIYITFFMQLNLFKVVKLN